MLFQQATKRRHLAHHTRHQARKRLRTKSRVKHAAPILPDRALHGHQIQGIRQRAEECPQRGILGQRPDLGDLVGGAGRSDDEHGGREGEEVEVVDGAERRVGPAECVGHVEGMGIGRVLRQRGPDDGQVAEEEGVRGHGLEGLAGRGDGEGGGYQALRPQGADVAAPSDELDSEGGEEGAGEGREGEEEGR